MKIFAQISKVDEATHKVWGRAVEETPDLAGEIFDYVKSKPYFQSWSEGLAKATDGKSVGNVRAMHGKIAAGKLSEITFVDAEKAIDVCAEIVDANEWSKVVKGVYTGFSIGGKYVGDKVADPVNKNLQRYTANPSEISLVDLPCVPTAQFSVIKADGSQEMRKFEHSLDDEGLQKWADGLTDADADEVLAKIAQRKGVNPKEGEKKYGDAKFADMKNKKYPLDTDKHIRAAWAYIHMPKNSKKYDMADVKTIKARIVEAWKAMIDKAGPPSAQKVYAAQAERLTKVADAPAIADSLQVMIGGDPMEKGLWAVSDFASLLQNLVSLQNQSEAEAGREGDGSPVPAALMESIKSLSQVFLDMATEEVGEAVNGPASKSAGDSLNKGYDMNELQKVVAERDELTKALDLAKGEVTKRDDLLTQAAKALDERNALITKLEAMPESIKVSMRAVSKGADVEGGGEEVEKVTNPDGTENEALTKIKHSLAHPIYTNG